ALGGEKPASFQLQYNGKDEESAGTLDWESSKDEEWEWVQDRRIRTLSSPNTRRAAAVRFFWILFGFVLPMGPAVIPKRVNKPHPETPFRYARSKCHAK